MIFRKMINSMTSRYFVKHQGERAINKDLYTLYSFSFVQVFIPLGFSWQGFNEAVSHACQYTQNFMLRMVMYSFSLRPVFVPLGFTGKVFNETYSISFVVSKGECCKLLGVEPTCWKGAHIIVIYIHMQSEEQNRSI